MDGVSKVHRHEALTRAQAIEALSFSEDARDRHLAELLKAGPQITPEDEARIMASVGLSMPLLRACVRVALG